MIDDAELRRQVERRLEALKAERATWFPLWRDVQEQILTRRGRFSLNERDRGERRDRHIVDNTGVLALRVLASGMMAGMTSPARPWFRLTTPDMGMMAYRQVREWLQTVEKTLMLIFARSNFYQALFTVYEELGAIGTAGVIVVEDYEDVIRVHPLTVGEYCLANSARLSVNTCYREYNLTVGQMVEEFGAAACSAAVQRLYDRGQVDAWVEVATAIEPNPVRDPARADAGNLPWRSVTWELGASGGKLLRRKGFHSNPVMAPRWYLCGTDVYGRSPGMDALGDVKALQLLQKRKAMGIDKLVNPPLVAPGSMKNQQASVLPGGVTYVDGAPGQAFGPAYMINPNLQHLVLDIEDTRRRIDRAFFVDLFLMMAESDRRQITAEEIRERSAEKMLMLGPVVERFQDEMLDPVIDRVFDIAYRAGVFPPPPPELQGGDLRVEYISVLALAQRSAGTGAIERAAGFIGSLAAAHPAALDKLDADAAIDSYAELIGAPPQVIRGAQDVAQLRQQRDKQAAAAQAQELALRTAEGARTLSETDTGAGRNALMDMMGLQ